MNARKSKTKIRLVVFDMDGVLVDVKSSWQFIHEAFGRSNWENVERYTRGEITYSELMRRDIASGDEFTSTRSEASCLKLL